MNALCECGCEGYSATSAHIDYTISNNATWQDAVQFIGPSTYSWSLAGCTFEMSIKRNRYDKVPLLTLLSAAGQIIIDDPIQRVIHTNVPATVIQANLPVGVYVYDLLMTDTQNPPVVTSMTHGEVCVKQGVT